MRGKYGTKIISQNSRKGASPDIESLLVKIARKAYEVYEREDGRDIEHWLAAEKLVTGSQKKK